MQQTLPANLKYYQQSGGYVPPHVQQQMAQHMQQSMPEHLKQYINPYMQQSVVPQHLTSMQAPRQLNYNPPSHATTFVPDHKFTGPLTDQSTKIPSLTGQPETTQPEPAASNAQQTDPSIQPYDFITNSQTPKSTPSLLLSGKPLILRIAVFGGGLIVLLILASIIKGLLVPGFNDKPFLSVLQDQQELIHLTGDALGAENGNANLSLADQNFIANAQLTLTSAQTQLTNYLTLNKQIVTPREQNLKVSTSLDNQLVTALSAGNYPATFQGIMSNQLAAYTSDMRQAYAETSGVRGHNQLRMDISQNALLIMQLNEVAGASG
jgi:hypothetical protein